MLSRIRSRATVRSLVVFVGLAGVGVAWATLAGCGGSNKKQVGQPVLTSRYQTLPPKQVPAFLKDTVLERCDLINTDPFPVSGFGLVSNLRGTGDSFVGTAVREYILKQMVNHGFGSRQMGFENMQPEDILKDPRFAIVRVDGLIPPGARASQRIDVYVSALDGNNTTSLAHGDLYRTDLKINGANLQAPGYAIDAWAAGQGAIFVNPAYALTTTPTTPEQRLSLRRGSVLDGGVVAQDRPLILRVRQPQLSMSRAIEWRLDQQFQDRAVAAAKDEARIEVYVPPKYGTDWEHFGQVAMHLFLNATPDFAVIKAKQLAEEAVKPDAPLLDISYCWEGLGPAAIPFLAPLLTHERPEVAFAAARAAAFLGDSSAQSVLLQMARTTGHPFQINAVQVLGKLPNSPVINQMLRQLLDADQTLVRLEAYRALVANEDSSIISRILGQPGQRFVLDIVPSHGAPLVYASRSGTPRIAVIGAKSALKMPVLFTAMENRLSISSGSDSRLLTIYYRGPEIRKPVTVLSAADLPELIGRLGGDGAADGATLNFSYCDIVALVQAMSDQQRLCSLGGKNGAQPVAFVLQQPSRAEQQFEEAPMIPEQATAIPEPATAPALAPAAEKVGAAVGAR